MAIPHNDKPTLMSMPIIEVLRLFDTMNVTNFLSYRTPIPAHGKPETMTLVLRLGDTREMTFQMPFGEYERMICSGQALLDLVSA